MVSGLVARGTVIVPIGVSSRDSFLANQSISSLAVNSVSMSLGIGLDLILLFLGKGGGEYSINIIPGEIIRLGQIFKYFKVSDGVFHKGSQSLTDLGAIQQRERDMYLNNPFCPSILP